MPARLRQASPALDHPHLDATTSYRTTNKHGYHYHHGHRSNQYQKENGYKNNHNKYKYKAGKGPKNVPTADHMRQNSEYSDSGSDGTGEKETSQNATEGNKSNFGLRKASRETQILPCIKIC